MFSDKQIPFFHHFKTETNPKWSHEKAYAQAGTDKYFKHCKFCQFFLCIIHLGCKYGLLGSFLFGLVSD